MGDPVCFFLHLFFVFIYVGSITVASVLRFYAAYFIPNKSSDVVLLLSIIRPLVALVVISLLIVMAFGFWTAVVLGYGLSEPWLIVTYALLGWVFAVGGFAGRMDRFTRYLAMNESLGDKAYGTEVISQELKNRLRDPVALSLNLSMVVAAYVILGMMVFRPGSSER